MIQAGLFLNSLIQLTISLVRRLFPVAKRLFPLFAASLLGLGIAAGSAGKEAAHDRPEISAAELPEEAREAIKRIDRGGPFPYRQDGTVFFNREGLLPAAPRGYYREYTVTTLDSRDRGPKRIIRGNRGELYYTHDHYRTFKKVLR